MTQFGSPKNTEQPVKKQRSQRKKHSKLKIAISIIAAIVAALVVIAAAAFFYFRRQFGSEASGINNIVASSNSSYIVNTNNGRIAGQKENNSVSFHGVPYAQATARFERAKPVKAWDGVYEAKNYGKISPQASLMGMSNPFDRAQDQDNNSQNLNIWTPQVNDHKKRAVMVWLHGGGFSLGSANQFQYNGSDLASAQDMVVVGVNHRLNVYGCLNLSQYGERYADSANVGLYDIIDALEWIRDNIESFGGDPDNVTLFGQSGGGAKILALMSAPIASNLFQRGIVESGATNTMGVHFSSEEVSQYVTERLLAHLNINKQNIDDIQTVSNDELQQAGAHALSEAGEKFKILAPLSTNYGVEWGPVVDGKLLPSDPLHDGKFADAAGKHDLLIGSNLNEWAGMGGAVYNNLSQDELDEYAKAYPEFSQSDEDLHSHASYIDAFIRIPMLRLARAKAAQSAKVYNYVYTSGGSSNSSRHGAEIDAVFARGDMGKTVSTLWASFAKTGVPEALGVPEWEPMTADNGATLIIDTSSRMAYHHDEQLMHMLDDEAFNE